MAEESARKAGMEAPQRAYNNIKLKMRVRRSMSEAAALVRELDHDDEYTAAVALPPAPQANRSPDNGDKNDENEAGIISA